MYPNITMKMPFSSFQAQTKPANICFLFLWGRPREALCTYFAPLFSSPLHLNKGLLVSGVPLGKDVVRLDDTNLISWQPIGKEAVEPDNEANNKKQLETTTAEKPQKAEPLAKSPSAEEQQGNQETGSRRADTTAKLRKLVVLYSCHNYNHKQR